MKNINKQHGQSMVEYIVVTLFAVFVLFVPIDKNDKTVIQAMKDALKGSYEGYAYTISVAELPDEPDK